MFLLLSLLIYICFYPQLDPVELLAEEAQKLPCRRFFQTGSCDFGDNCRYSHTNQQLLLEQQGKHLSDTSSNVRCTNVSLIVLKNYNIVYVFFVRFLAARARSSSSISENQPKLSDWLAKWEKKQKYKQGNKDHDATKETSVADENVTFQSFILPASFPPLSQLPPSMLPPPPGGFPKLPKIEWG